VQVEPGGEATQVVLVEVLTVQVAPAGEATQVGVLACVAKR
jgi:hypothetical protein